MQRCRKLSQWFLYKPLTGYHNRGQVRNRPRGRRSDIHHRRTGQYGRVLSFWMSRSGNICNHDCISFHYRRIFSHLRSRGTSIRQPERHRACQREQSIGHRGNATGCAIYCRGNCSNGRTGGGGIGYLRGAIRGRVAFRHGCGHQRRRASVHDAYSRPHAGAQFGYRHFRRHSRESRLVRCDGNSQPLLGKRQQSDGLGGHNFGEPAGGQGFGIPRRPRGRHSD